MLKSTSVSLLSISLLCVSMASLARADIAIIANKNSDIDSLSPTQARKLWLGKIHKLPGTEKITVIDQSSSSLIKEAFYSKLAHKNKDQLKTHWAKIIFTGKAMPPKAVSSDKKVLDIVSANKNTLGYINSNSVTDNVKVLMSIK